MNTFKTALILAMLLLATGAAVAQKHECDSLDLNHTNGPICTLPEMITTGAADGYVSALGVWSPDGKLMPKGANVEFTCVKTAVPQVSHSRTGYCLMAGAYLFESLVTVATTYFDVVSWGEKRIIAERGPDWTTVECETQRLVLDFAANTVTLTSNLIMTGHCGERYAKTNDTAKVFRIDPLKQTEVFSLVHAYATMYAQKKLNPFLKD